MIVTNEAAMIPGISDRRVLQLSHIGCLLMAAEKLMTNRGIVYGIR
jgi:hypothetical protein